MRDYQGELKFREAAKVGARFLKIKAYHHYDRRECFEVTVTRETKTQITLSDGATLVRKTGHIVGTSREAYASTRVYYVAWDEKLKAELESERALGKAKRAVQDAIAEIGRLRVPALLAECEALSADLKALVAKYAPKEESGSASE